MDPNPLLEYHPGDQRKTGWSILYILLFACAQFLITLGGMFLVFTSWLIIGLLLIALALLANAVVTLAVTLPFASRVEPEHRFAFYCYCAVAAFMIPFAAIILEVILGVALWAR
jgi:hypothetical protein